MFAVVHGIVAFAVVFVRPHFAPQLFVVGGDHAAFAAGGHDFVLAERPSADMADRADGFAFVFRTVRLGAVFDNPQVMFFGQSHDVVHFGRHTGKVNHDDGFGVWRQSGFDGFGADVLAVQIDIGENRIGAGGHDAGCGSQESARSDNHIIALADAHCFEGYVQSQRTVGKGDGVLRADKSSKFFFKFTTFRTCPVVDFVGQQDFGNGIGFFLSKAWPWGE